MKIGCGVILLILLVLFTIGMVERQRVDTIEKAVGEALGDKDLVLGMKLRYWIDNLGVPDRIVKYSHPRITRTELYWLKRGIAVRISGEEFLDLELSLNNEVTLLIIPTKKDLPSDFMQNRQIVWPRNETATSLKFEALLDIKIGGVNINNMNVSEIAKLYKHFDPSGNSYYNLLFPFGKYSTVLYYDAKCPNAWTCNDSVDLILVYYTDYLNARNYIKIIRDVARNHSSKI